jgi:hypothetical protein
LERFSPYTCRKEISFLLKTQGHRKEVEPTGRALVYYHIPLSNLHFSTTVHSSSKLA